MIGRLEWHVRVKAQLMRYLLTIPDCARILAGSIERLRLTEEEKGKAVRGYAVTEYGPDSVQKSVAALNETFMQEVFEQIVDERMLGKLLEYVQPAMRYYVKPILELEGESLVIDTTGLLTYAIVKNKKCLEKLHSYVQMDGVSFQAAFEQSVYVDAPFLSWFRISERQDVIHCVGLLQEQDVGDGVRRFLSIVESGYRRLKNEIRRWGRMDGEQQFALLYESGNDAGDPVYQASVMAMELVMAKIMKVPLPMNLGTSLAFMNVRRFCQEALEEEDGLAITEEGQESWREMMEQYHCDNYVMCCEQRPERKLTSLLREQSTAYGAVRTLDYREVFAMFHLHPLILSGIHLSKTEMQQIFSAYPRLNWEGYLPFLLAATLCKYIAELHGSYPSVKEGEAVRLRQIEAEEETKQLKRKLRELENSLEQVKREKDEYADALNRVREELERRKEQLARVGQEQKRWQREAGELRDYICQTDGNVDASERETMEKSDGSGEPEEQELRTALSHRQVVAIGGHANWQRRFREIFPEWQFLAAGKNNYDPALIRNRDVIIINTAVLKHSSYYRMLAERGEEQIVLYVRGNNPARCIRELAGQLRSREQKE